MYKATIWKDDVPGVQEGTDMNAANFNNNEVGTMEAHALAALLSAQGRYAADEAADRKVVAIEATLTGTTTQSVVIPAAETRNRTSYRVDVELKTLTGGTAGDVVISAKQANGFSAKYNGTATSIVAVFKVSGGMI